MVVQHLHTVPSESSIPSITTKQCLSDVMAACRSPKPFVGVRGPRGMPNKGREIISRRSALEHLPSTNFSRIVKWYNGRLISDYYKFNSCSGNQFRPTRIMALRLFCNQDTAVRFCRGAPIMEGYQGWALHCLENRWIAKAVGVRFYHPSSKLCVVSLMVEPDVANV